MADLTQARWPLRRTALYLMIAAGSHLLWETTQLPLYTTWWTASPAGILSRWFIAPAAMS